MILGITGLIGSGKTVAADYLRTQGAFIIDADLIGRQVVQSSKTLRAKLARAFGSDVLTTRGNLRRSLVAKRAFADQRSRRILDNLVHPFLLNEIKKQVKAVRKNHELVVIDAALLINWGLHREVDLVLLIHASLDKRLGRLTRRGLSLVDAIARTRAQLTYSEYRSRADIVIFNNGSKGDLVRKMRSKLSRFI